MDDLRGEPRMETEVVGYVDLTRLHGAKVGHAGVALVACGVAGITTAMTQVPRVWITSTKSRVRVTKSSAGRQSLPAGKCESA